MTLQENFSAYIKKYDGEVLLNEPLRSHCSFRIGGDAQIMYIPHNEKALIAAVEFADNNSVPLYILGNGTNVLIPDSGLKGIVIKIMGGLTDIIYLGSGVIACGAGVSLTKLCLFALEKSLTGLEFAYGIPGSVGGAVYMNAGAYGGEMKNVLMSVRCIDRKTREPEELQIENLTYSYRNTSFMTSDKIITAAYIQLGEGKKDEIGEKMTELLGKRKKSQPLEFPSAGSTFKRPHEGYAAAMIDEAGLKGATVGGAQVSEKHAGFVINTGNATFSDVTQLMDIVTEKVYEKFSVTLEPEVEILK